MNTPNDFALSLNFQGYCAIEVLQLLLVVVVSLLCSTYPQKTDKNTKSLNIVSHVNLMILIDCTVKDLEWKYNFNQT